MNKYLITAAVAISLIAPVPTAAQDQCTPVRCPQGSPCTVDLFGGQTIDAGDVTFSQDGDLLFVQIDTQDGWEFDTLHVYVGSEPVPTNGGGNVKPGRFPYSIDFDAPVSGYSQVISLSSLGIDVTADDCDAPGCPHRGPRRTAAQRLGPGGDRFRLRGPRVPRPALGLVDLFSASRATREILRLRRDCDPFSQTEEEFYACCELNPDDIDCEGPVD